MLSFIKVNTMIKKVTAGLIINNNKLLIAQRKKGKSCELLWEFPGGKLEEGETLENCLSRELKEELNIEIKIGEFFMSSLYNYDFGSIELNAFWAKTEACNLSYHPDHEQVLWVDICDIDRYEFAPADKPIVEALKKQLH